MVNFNNEITVGTPAAEVVKILVLQARANVFESLEFYLKQKHQGIAADLSVLRARLGTWLLEHEGYLQRTYDKDPIYKQIIIDLFERDKPLDQNTIINYIRFLNNICDTLRLTRLDLRKQYDRSSWETDNRENQLG